MDEYVSKSFLVAKFNELASKYADGDKRQRGLAYTTAADIIAFTDVADVKPALSEEEYDSLCKRMTECANMGVEDGHIAADAILLEALKKMGYEKLVELYRELDKWYA